VTNKELRNRLLSLRNSLGRCVNLCDALLKLLETEANHGTKGAHLTKNIEHKATVLFVLTNRTLYDLGVHAAQGRKGPD
jgi:hypothetical protein